MSGSVQEYLEKHKLSIRIEEAVNAAVRARTEDPVAFIAHHLHKHSVSVITRVHATQVLDARGVPAVEAEVHTSRGSYRAISPSGANSSIYAAAKELRDGESQSMFGMGVRLAVSNVMSKIGPALIGKDPREQADIDKLMSNELDHDDTQGLLGSNAVLAVSMAVCKAGAAEKDLPLYEHIADLAGLPLVSIPAPVFTLISARPHIANGLPFQELLCLPSEAESLSDAIRIGVETSHALVNVVREQYGEEGLKYCSRGILCPPVASAVEGFTLILQAAERAGHKDKIALGIDAAAKSRFSPDGTYDVGKSMKGSVDGDSIEKGGDVKGARTTALELPQMYQDLASEYTLAFIIDPFEVEDFSSAAALTAAASAVGFKVFGGDLVAGNVKRIAQAAASKACNGQDLKIPFVGTLTEAIAAIRAAKDAEWTTMMSCCTGESEDSLLADLAVGLGVHWLRCGPLTGAQHTAKYNRLLMIEDGKEGKVPYLKPDVVAAKAEECPLAPLK